MIDRGHNLPLGRQAELLRLSLSTLYYEPRPVPAAELAIMRRIDELHLDYPFAGSRMLRDLLRGEDVVIGRELVATLMRRMGIEAIYRKPNTSKAALGHKIYPYLLRGRLCCMDVMGYISKAYNSRPRGLSPKNRLFYRFLC